MTQRGVLDSSTATSYSNGRGEAAGVVSAKSNANMNYDRTTPTGAFGVENEPRMHGGQRRRLTSINNGCGTWLRGCMLKRIVLLACIAAALITSIVAHTQVDVALVSTRSFRASDSFTMTIEAMRKQLMVGQMSAQPKLYVTSLDGVVGAAKENSGRLNTFRQHWNGTNITVCPGTVDTRRGFGITHGLVNCLGKAISDSVEIALFFEDDAVPTALGSNFDCLRAEAVPTDAFIIMFGGHHFKYGDTDAVIRGRCKYRHITLSYGAYGFAVPRASLVALQAGYQADLQHPGKDLSPDVSWFNFATQAEKRVYVTQPHNVYHPAGYSNTWKRERSEIVDRYEYEKHTVVSGKDIAYALPPDVSSWRTRLVIGVLSANRDRRDVIRETWGKDRSLLFIVAAEISEDDRRRELNGELQRFGDLLILSMTDSYNSLAFKTQVFFTVVSRHVEEYEYVLKTDDDSFVDVDELLSVLAHTSPDYWGRVSPFTKPHREPDSQWYMPTETFPHSVYPPFCSGAGYVVSEAFLACAVPKMSALPNLVLEDVATGILAQKCSVTPVNAGSLVQHTKPEDSRFIIRHRVTITIEAMRKLMAGLMSTKKLTTKLEPNSLGNNMFAFQSLLGIAKINHLRPVFARDELQDLNRTFALDHSRFDIKYSEAYEDGGTFDHFEALPSLRRNVNTRIGRYLQSIEYFLPLNQSLRSFWTLRPRHMRAARRLLPASNSVCVHRRYFPAKHLENREHVCPTPEALQQLLTRISAGKTVVVFSNDIARAKTEIATTSIQFVDSGAIKQFQSGDRAEVLPTDADLVARDFAALTICDDLVVTCGTFGGFAGVLHSGKGSVFYFSDHMLTAGHNNRTYGTRALSKWKLSTSRR